MCRSELSYRSTTNNLRKYMQRKHPLFTLTGEGIEGNEVTEQRGDVMEIDMGDETKPETSRVVTEISKSPEPVIKTPTTVHALFRKKSGVIARKNIDHNLILFFLPMIFSHSRLLNIMDSENL
ncbi:hypothetical protein JTB14_003714 [Gonioctena quinquepunctata]|nr:hypothetical protein JTB14_003714 [Gonioctena quinquepunctata]